ncbi:MAG: hypothetical protein HGA22_01425 [Clostridiales bacterium]|nr:hypothetical protein [Clostridiales bacterium]
MNKYGQTAVLSMELINKRKTDNPVDAWKQASMQVFGGATSSQAKGSPRDTFLGLCEAGLVKGIRTGDYTRSEKNKRYAIKAVEALKEVPALAENPDLLWRAVLDYESTDASKAHNSQMNVVVGLWENGLIRL